MATPPQNEALPPDIRRPSGENPSSASAGSDPPASRAVLVLACAQALAGCGTLVLVTFGGIVGSRIAPSPALATLPLSLGIVGLALASLPAALLMQRIGRRPAFIGSACLAAAIALLCAWSVANAAFWMLCVAGLLLGASAAFVQQYRFAAMEFVPGEHAARAVSTVMIGTLVAAFAGPGAGELARNLGGWPEFTGSFVVLAGLYLAAAAVLTLLPRTPPVPAGATPVPPRPGRPFAAVLAQTNYRVAVLGGLVSYAVMSFIMTATPLSMHVHDGFSSGATTAVITAHLLGMYLPSLATPWLSRRLGIVGLMRWGVVGMAACVLIAAFVGQAFVHYFAALVLLGLGWNLLFVGSTALLGTTYAPQERFRAQGVNDLMVFGSQALASLCAGIAIETVGWAWVNLATLPLLLAALWTTRLLGRREALDATRA